MQREFLDSISTDGPNNRRPLDRGPKHPIANQFALGYTYQNVLDADQEGAYIVGVTSICNSLT
jgi:dynein light intermediate chain 1